MGSDIALGDKEQTLMVFNQHYILRILRPITEKPKIVPLRHGSEFTVVIGDELVIPCDVTAYPPPTIVWTHDGRVVVVVKPGYRQLDSGAYM